MSGTLSVSPVVSRWQVRPGCPGSQTVSCETTESRFPVKEGCWLTVGWRGVDCRQSGRGLRRLWNGHRYPGRQDGNLKADRNRAGAASLPGIYALPQQAAWFGAQDKC